MALQINIYTPGANDKSIEDLLNNYQKRLLRYAELKWCVVKSGDNKTENNSLLNKIKNINYIVLDENGKDITTKDIANKFSTQMHSGNPVINLVIGGAYGLNKEVIENAESIWAFGKITLPHQLVRLVTVEQIYRAMTINNNHPYHHQ